MYRGKNHQKTVLHLEYERVLVDKVLDLEEVVPLGLTAHDASFQWKGILKEHGTGDHTTFPVSDGRGKEEEGVPPPVKFEGKMGAHQAGPLRA